MKLTIETTPEQDEALQIELDASMIGRGKDEPPTLEDFTIAKLVAVLDGSVKNVDATKRSDLKSIIDSADAVKLAAIEAAAR